MEYNFNEHIVQVLANKFAGSERKETIILDDGNEYLLKLPDPTREVRRTISYINNAVSEYIGCKVMKSVGLPVQDVVLGLYTTRSESGENKTYLGCACKNLEHDGLSLAPAESAALGSYESAERASHPSFEALPVIAKCTPDVSLDEIRRFYSEMFVADALIGNTDRHNGNWGFLTGKQGTSLSPIYDCGSSLCPLLGDDELTEKLAANNAINAASAIQDTDGKRIKYAEYLGSHKNPDVDAALKEIVPRMNLRKICRLIDDTPYISDARKDFYKAYVTASYERVLLPALESLLQRDVGDIASDRNVDAYPLYKRIIEPMKSVPLCEDAAVLIDSTEPGQPSGKSARKAMVRPTNSRIIITDDSGMAEAVISSRSKDGEVRASAAALSQIYGIPMDKLRVTVLGCASLRPVGSGGQDKEKNKSENTAHVNPQSPPQPIETGTETLGGRGSGARKATSGNMDSEDETKPALSSCGPGACGDSADGFGETEPADDGFDLD